MIHTSTIRKVTRGSSVMSTGDLRRPRERFLSKGSFGRAVSRRGNEQNHDRANSNQKQITIMPTLGSQSHLQFISYRVRSPASQTGFATQQRIYFIKDTEFMSSKP